MEHKVYQKFSGTFQVDGQTFEYEGEERDWNAHSLTPEEIDSLGRVAWLRETTFDLVAWGESFDVALKRLHFLIRVFLERNKNQSKTLGEVVAAMDANWDGVTRPGAYYSTDGQCTFWYIEDVPYYAQWINKTITVYRALDDHRIIGGMITLSVKTD